MSKHTLINTIDQTYKAKKDAAEGPFRRHLGGSMIGKNCERELYYSFRWFKRSDFAGRMLRLFDRGHSEEFKNVNLLRSVGIEVRGYTMRLLYDEARDVYETENWGTIATGPRCDEDGKPVDPQPIFKDVTADEWHVERAEAQGVNLTQWRISDVNGHFGGSTDGEAVAPFDIPVLEFIPGRGMVDETGEVIPHGTKFLLEFKTHNTKSFVNLVTEGVKVSKPIHWTQMQIYMHKRGYKFALYMAINKNDDDLHIEIVRYDPEEGPKLVEKAARVIYATHVPNRIGKHASWIDCKWCDFSKICHYGDQSLIDRNCRTCVNSVPVDDGQWHCKKWDAIIPVDAVLLGCESHKVITD